MTVACPSCDARFRDPPAYVGAARPLMCGVCEHEWMPQSAGGSAKALVNAPALAPTMEDLIKNTDDAIMTALPVVMPNHLEAQEKKIEPTYVDRAMPPLAPRSMMPALSMSAFACLALFAGAVSFKSVIMSKFPQTQGIYLAAGLTSENPGLEIANVVTTKTKRDGIRQLIVKGEIANIADNTVPVPPLKLIMRNVENANLYGWTVTTSKPSLKAGEKSRFTAVAHDFPPDAVNVEVEFAPKHK